MKQHLKALTAFLAASLLCVATLWLRIARTGEPHYAFLVWNLFLAWIPLIASTAAYASASRGRRWAEVSCGVLWFLFFPNAPYILTDFVHLRAASGIPLWYDGLMLSSFAWTGLMLGFASLYLMQLIWLRAYGRTASWLGVALTLALASIGIYMGRVLRFNSWDVVTRPGEITSVMLHKLASPLEHLGIAATLVVLTASMMVGYVVLYSITSLRLDLERDLPA